MFIGQTEAVERAVANNRTQRRNTALTHRITHTEIAVLAPGFHAAIGQLAWELRAPPRGRDSGAQST